MRTRINDTLLSIFCGLALLVTVRAGNTWLVSYLPDEWLFLRSWSWLSPLDRLALARLFLFLPIVAVGAILLSWPLAHHASKRDYALTMPGAACAAVVYFLATQASGYHPYPIWLDVVRALLLFAAFPAATWLWWRRRS